MLAAFDRSVLALYATGVALPVVPPIISHRVAVGLWIVIDIVVHPLSQGSTAPGTDLPGFSTRLCTESQAW